MQLKSERDSIPWDGVPIFIVNIFTNNPVQPFLRLLFVNLLSYYFAFIYHL